MTINQNITSKYEEERLRAAEQSQIVYLQGQIDELRRLVKDQTNKYNWAMEQVRRVEGSVAQIEGVLDRHRQEVVQALDTSRRDVGALRKEIGTVLIRAEESVKPLREMQSQIHQIAEVRKQDRDQTAGWLVRIEDLEERTRGWQAQIRESDDRHRALATRFESMLTIEDTLRGEIRKVYEELQIEKQSLRRQAVEAQQLVADVRGVLDEHNSRITRLDEIRQHIELFAEQLPPQITVLQQKLVGIVDEYKHIERVSTERFLMNQERLEELRHQQDEKLLALQDTDEQHLRQLTTWLERVDSIVRELEQRQTRSVARLDVIQREHAGQLAFLERRDVQMIETLSLTFQTEYERVKAEQIARGGPTTAKDE